MASVTADASARPSTFRFKVIGCGFTTMGCAGLAGAGIAAALVHAHAMAVGLHKALSRTEHAASAGTDDRAWTGERADEAAGQRTFRRARGDRLAIADHFTWQYAAHGRQSVLKISKNMIDDRQRMLPDVLHRDIEILTRRARVLRRHLAVVALHESAVTILELRRVH